MAPELLTCELRPPRVYRSACAALPILFSAPLLFWIVSTQRRGLPFADAL